MFGPYKSLPDVIRLIKINLINPNSLSFYEDLPARYLVSTLQKKKSIS